MEERACGGREGDETRGKRAGGWARGRVARRNMAGESREIGARRRNLVSPLSLASADPPHPLCRQFSPGPLPPAADCRARTRVNGGGQESAREKERTVAERESAAAREKK